MGTLEVWDFRAQGLGLIGLRVRKLQCASFRARA